RLHYLEESSTACIPLELDALAGRLRLYSGAVRLGRCNNALRSNARRGLTKTSHLFSWDEYASRTDTHTFLDILTTFVVDCNLSDSAYGRISSSDKVNESNARYTPSSAIASPM